MILLVEDNPDDVALAVRALRRNQITSEVVVVQDGVEALDYLFAGGAYADRDPSVLPQVILLDVKLPRVNGLEVLRRVRADERTRLVPVVMLTTSVEPRDVVDAYSSYANSYIRKPVDFAAFTEAVGQLGAYWLTLNEPPPGTT